MKRKNVYTLTITRTDNRTNLLHSDSLYELRVSASRLTAKPEVLSAVIVSNITGEVLYIAEKRLYIYSADECAETTANPAE